MHAANDKMCRFDFRCFLMECFGMNEDLMMDRMFTFFDKKIDGTVTREEWVVGLSVVLRGDLDELTAYAFFVYDLNQDGLISKEEMWCMLKDALFCPGFQEEADEGIRDLIQMTKKKLDLDKDDAVSFEDFSGTVKRDPTMTLEVFGPCLPSEKVETIDTSGYLLKLSFHSVISYPVLSDNNFQLH